MGGDSVISGSLTEDLEVMNLHKVREGGTLQPQTSAPRNSTQSRPMELSHAQPQWSAPMQLPNSRPPTPPLLSITPSMRTNVEEALGRLDSLDAARYEKYEERI